MSQVDILIDLKPELEAKLQARVIKAIKEEYDTDVWIFKTRDYCRIGIPDLLICFFGHFIAIELKRPHGAIKVVGKYNGKKTMVTAKKSDPLAGVTPMQKHNIIAINKSCGSAFVGRDIDDIMRKLREIRKDLDIYG